MHFYLLTCTNRCPPVTVGDYAHIKGHPDGGKIAACSMEGIGGDGVRELSFDEMQDLLDEWIDTENAVAPIDEITGQPILQSRINLQAWI